MNNSAYIPVEKVVENTAPVSDRNLRLVAGDVRSRFQSDYMTTIEAAEYLRKSKSWLVKQADMPYLKGAPNLYSRKDLDAWFERHKFIPKVA